MPTAAEIAQQSLRNAFKMGGETDEEKKKKMEDQQEKDRQYARELDRKGSRASAVLMQQGGGKASDILKNK